MKELLAALPGYLAAHVGLSLAALTIGVLVSVPLGVLVARSPRAAPLVLGVATVVQTIPSLALLAFMVPALAAIGAQSIGVLPALIGLTLYSVLPILRNTVAGLAGVDPALIEAARGVGMSPREQLLRVELPLALPVIVAGIRTSAVWTVGTATLSTPVGAPSLGNYIFSGLQTRNYASVLVGCVASAALALALDGLVRVAEIGVRLRRRSLVAGSAGALALLAAFALFPVARGLGRAEPEITVGAKTFTEQYILSRVVSGWVHRATGLPVRALDSLGSTVAFDALRSSQIDLYVDYTGTLWTTVLKRSDLSVDDRGSGSASGPAPRYPVDRAAMRVELEAGLRERFGVTLVAALGFENTYALAVRRKEADRLGLRRIGDLAPRARSMVAGGDYELFQRPEWRSIERAYGLSFRELRSMDPSLMYDAVASGSVDVIGAFSTDGRVAAFDLAVLDDDRGAIPPYDAVILASPRLSKERPEVIASLRGLEGTIDAARMRRLNVAVDQSGDAPSAVAERFLAELAAR